MIEELLIKNIVGIFFTFATVVAGALLRMYFGFNTLKRDFEAKVKDDKEAKSKEDKFIEKAIGSIKEHFTIELQRFSKYVEKIEKRIDKNFDQDLDFQNDTRQSHTKIMVKIDNLYDYNDKIEKSMEKMDSNIRGEIKELRGTTLDLSKKVEYGRMISEKVSNNQ